MTAFAQTFPAISPGPGVVRRVLSHSPELMMVQFDFETGAEGKLHNHPHVQSTFVHSGRFRFCVGEKSFEVGPGDSFVIPTMVMHGCVALEGGRLIDSFTPRRDDFL